ncbi:MAG: glycoside hydrolase family 99-like domain-containing protein [Candidatus Riflebacteria bacterium]|nr:glycoside hydrolase family 99-like domain-containing protein [Candidatus Riflebacteria bacterium]
MKIAAYYYPGWHKCPIRNASLPQGWSEWDLVYKATPRFEGHEQPNLPLWGKHDDSDPKNFELKIQSALNHGVDAFIFAFYWSRGKILLDAALDKGFLKSPNSGQLKFAVFWANRMPRWVLPVKDPAAMIIDPKRLVYTDEKDFLEFVQFIAENYFSLPNYLKINEKPYLSIFDTNFFLRQLGMEKAKNSITRAKHWLKQNGFGGLHLAGIDPIPEFAGNLKEIGFDSVTHYVFMPDWKGEYLQDYWTSSNEKSEKWGDYMRISGLPYMPSVSTGWDATPRSSDYGKEKPRKYPWWPVITGRSPDRFRMILEKALKFSYENVFPEAPVFISSWNEWSEGHYLEPDQKHGYSWLEAIKAARSSRFPNP